MVASIREPAGVISERAVSTTLMLTSMVENGKTALLQGVRLGLGRATAGIEPCSGTCHSQNSTTSANLSPHSPQWHPNQAWSQNPALSGVCHWKQGTRRHCQVLLRSSDVTKD